MKTELAIGLILFGIVLFAATRARWIDSQAVQDLANVAAVIALLIGIAAYFIPVSPLPLVATPVPTSLDPNATATSALVRAPVETMVPTATFPPPTEAPPVTELPITRQVIISNQCAYPIRLALRYHHPESGWLTDGWWEIGANKITYLNSANSELITANEGTFYYYGELIEDKGIVWSGDTQVDFADRLFPMQTQMATVNEAGAFVLSLSCPNLPDPASAEGYEVIVENKCSHPIRLALRYCHPQNGWQTNGWWFLDGDEKSRLVSGDVSIMANKWVFYFYAEATDGSGIQWNGSEPVYFGDQELSMVNTTVTLVDGQFLLSLSCNQ